MSLRVRKQCYLEPKSLFYQNDGTGRDSYIRSINGGLYSQNLMKKQEPTPKNTYSPLYLQNITIHKVQNPPPVDIRLIHYQCDGSGRDTYIKVNDGGRSNDISGRANSDQIFYGGLRQYGRSDNSVNLFQKSSISSLFTHKSEKDLMLNKMMKKYQLEHSLFLSQPKVKEDNTSQSPKPKDKQSSQMFPTIHKKQNSMDPLYTQQ